MTPQIYRVEVVGTIQARWLRCLGRVTHVPGDLPTTVLETTVMDQAALRGLLNYMWDRNLTVVSVHGGSGGTDGGEAP